MNITAISKKPFLLIVALGLTLTAFTQNTPYKATHEGWLVSIDEAFTLSKKTGKPIMANFTGSDWCGWCKRLSAAVFFTT